MRMTDTEHSSKAPRGTGILVLLRAFLRVNGSGALSVLSLALGVLFLSPVLASASSSHAFTGAFGEKGSAAGQLEPASNSGVAVDDATGDVYVADTGNHRVDEFESDGAFMRAWGWGVADGLAMLEACGPDANPATSCRQGLSGSQPGEFEQPAYIAVDNSPGGSGDVYVADTGTRLIQKFSAEGALEGSWGAEGQLGGNPFTVATGTGNLTVGSATGTGETTAGSTTITNVTTSTGAFTVGLGIEADTGIERNSSIYITAVGNGTLTISQPARRCTQELFHCTVSLNTNSRVVSDVKAVSGEFSEGEKILGEGIPPGTSIERNGDLQSGGVAVTKAFILTEAPAESRSGVVLSAQRELAEGSWGESPWTRPAIFGSSTEVRAN